MGIKKILEPLPIDDAPIDFNERLEAELKRYESRLRKGGYSEKAVLEYVTMKREDILEPANRENGLRTLHNENDIGEGKLKVSPTNPEYIKFLRKLALDEAPPAASGPQLDPTFVPPANMFDDVNAKLRAGLPPAPDSVSRGGGLKR